MEDSILHGRAICQSRMPQVREAAFYKVCGGTLDQRGYVRLLCALHPSSWLSWYIQPQLGIQIVGPEA